LGTEIDLNMAWPQAGLLQLEMLKIYQSSRIVFCHQQLEMHPDIGHGGIRQYRRRVLGWFWVVSVCPRAQELLPKDQSNSRVEVSSKGHLLDSQMS